MPRIQLEAGNDHIERSLMRMTAMDRATAALAPYLIALPNIEVIYDVARLSPRDNVVLESSYDLL